MDVFSCCQSEVDKSIVTLSNNNSPFSSRSFTSLNRQTCVILLGAFIWMSLQNRMILVRNDDTSITYIGNWTTVQAESAVNNLGNFGPAFSPTLHSTTTISIFSFSFHGSSINVVGTVNIANSSTNANPTWQCVLDGINLGSPNITQFPENNWSLCSQGNIPDDAHELVVNVTSQGMPFYLDNIQYRPSSSISLEDSLIVIQNDDPAIDYIPGWGSLGEIANQTTDSKSLVNVTFVGTQLSWYGFIPIEEPHDASSGEYSIDGQPYSSFQLLGISSSSTTTIYNQLFFITPTLEMGTHTLSAKYTGRPGQTPLTLDFLIVANGSFPFTNSSPPNSSRGAGENPTPNPAPLINVISKSSSHVGSVVGGVAGAVGGIAVCLIILFFSFRSRKRRSRDNVRSVIEPASIQSQFVVSQTAPLLAPGQNSGSQASSSNNPVSPAPYYATDQTLSSGPRRPLPTPIPPIQYIPSQPRTRSAPVGRTPTPTVTPIQNEESGIQLPQSAIDEIVIELPPTYSEQ